jgi:hypothetical protein
MAEWEEQGKTDDYLLPSGVQLKRGRAFIDDPGDVPVDDVREYVNRSIEEEQRRLEAEQAAATVEADVRADAPAVRFMTVSADETWSFSAVGQWTNGFVRCGPDGYRNFLADALQIEPRVAGRQWFELMGKIEGEPGSSRRNHPPA